jgi:adenylate kinase family enzyme
VDLLGVGDELRGRPHRILVAGTSGAGKTTLASRIGRALQITHTEIDALFHGPDWVPRATFVADVERLTAEPEWVTEWQYGVVRGLLADRADLLVWIDLPRRTVMRQVIARTLRRRWHRAVLWNGNVEPPLHTVFTDPEHIVRWAWDTYPLTAPRIEELQRRRPDLPIVRLRNRSEVERWCTGPLHRAAATARAADQPECEQRQQSEQLDSPNSRDSRDSR